MSRKFSEKHETESGKEINAMFSYTSISNRIVGSPEFVGTLYTLLKEVTKRALDAYDNGA